jgi:putative membrane protein
MLLFWGVLILLAVALTKGLSSNFGADRNRSARDLLDERFARGEIDQCECLEKKKLLT